MNFYLYHEIGRIGSDEYTQKFMGVLFWVHCIKIKPPLLESASKVCHFMECLNY